MGSDGGARVTDRWSWISGATLPIRALHVVAAAGALLLPWLLLPLTPTSASSGPSVAITVLMLLAVAAFHVELGRALVGGRVSTQQPHKALSAWAFAAAMLLPPPAVLVVVTLTYAHARWRGLKIQLWKWVVSGSYLVLAGCAAVVVRWLVLGPGVLLTGPQDPLGAQSVLALVAAAAAFLGAETLLLAASAWLNRADREEWLRGQLASRSFYVTEAGVLLVGALIAVLWSAGPWLTLLALPVHVLTARASLLQPVQERAATAGVLARENALLEEANTFKLQLLSMLGHEVGNPLTTVVGWSQIAAEAVSEGDLETAGAALVTAQRGAARTREVLADITAMVAADTGSLSAHPQEVDLPAALLEVTAGEGFATTIVCDAAARAWVQPGHLHQILGNLLSNAEKYAGGATTVRVVAPGPDTVRIDVEDAGSVPASVRDRLFERYARAEEHADQRGTGLGLSITRDLARANGGELTYRPSTRDARSGSVFSLSLPVPPTDRSRAADRSDARVPPSRASG